MNLHSGGKYHLKSMKNKLSRLSCCQLPNVSLCAQNQLTHTVDTSEDCSSVLCKPHSGLVGLKDKVLLLSPSRFRNSFQHI